MTNTTYRVWFEVYDDCWCAHSPEHPAVYQFGGTPLVALHNLMIALGQREPGSQVATISAPVVRPEFHIDWTEYEEPTGDGGG